MNQKWKNAMKKSHQENMSIQNERTESIEEQRNGNHSSPISQNHEA